MRTVLKSMGSKLIVVDVMCTKIHNPTSKYKEMEAVQLSCLNAGVSVPLEVQKYIEDYARLGRHDSIKVPIVSIGSQESVDIMLRVSDIPLGATTVLCRVSV